MLSNCAQRFGTSLIAATSQWLTYTKRRCVLVVSRDQFVLWAKSSKRAAQTGAFFRTKGKTVPVPATSPACQEVVPGTVLKADHEPGVWLQEPVIEYVIRSDSYDLTMSLLQLGAAPDFRKPDDEDDGLLSVSDFIRLPFKPPS
ncbi:MAG TPA: hypothetical protein VFA75_21360 [Nevskia sp.]|nr:hypothetical protein [Nevskia sp.]